MYSYNNISYFKAFYTSFPNFETTCEGSLMFPQMLHLILHQTCFCLKGTAFWLEKKKLLEKDILKPACDTSICKRNCKQ